MRNWDGGMLAAWPRPLRSTYVQKAANLVQQHHHHHHQRRRRHRRIQRGGVHILSAHAQREGLEGRDGREECSRPLPSLHSLPSSLRCPPLFPMMPLSLSLLATLTAAAGSGTGADAAVAADATPPVTGATGHAVQLR